MMEPGGNTAVLATPTGHNAAPGKPLKRTKSLTRLFTLSSKKSSRSRPPSPEDSDRPPTPNVPAQFWPLMPKTPDSLVSSPISEIHGNGGAHRLPEETISEHREGNTERATSKPYVPDLQKSKSLASARMHARQRNRSGSVGMYDTGRSESDELARLRQPEKPTTHRSPTFPVVRKPSITGRRMPSGSSSHPRGRGSSVTAPKTEGPPTLPYSTRPFTADGDAERKKPTGKRRQRGNTHGYDGSGPCMPMVEDFSFSPQRPWQTMYSGQEVRTSFRSALTTGSSHVDTTSTERSSILTKGTSITESTSDPQSRPVSKAGGMTVDDAIDMYAAGFTDDPDDDAGDSRDASMSEEERRRSVRIAEAINESMGYSLRTTRPLTSDTTSSSAIMSGEASRFESGLDLRDPPPIMPPTVNRDQYGFLKANHHISRPQYDAWNADYVPSQERRAKKWASHMRDQGLPTFLPTRFPSRSPKTQRFIRKGIPAAWRGAAWFYYAGGDAYLDKHPNLFNNLVSRSDTHLPENDKESIERDLHRTFPDNVHFKPDNHTSTSTLTSAELPLLVSLRRVLRAFALHSPKIGYCQSLNFVTGLLLLFLPEEKAFWMLHHITTVYLPGTHEISLEGANVDLWVLMVALKSTLPGIWAKVGTAGTGDEVTESAKLPPISLCTTSWFMSLFIGTLPIESVLRVWDVLFYEGSRTLFRVALTIFKLQEQRIRELNDSMELFQVVQGLPRGMIDAGALMRMVCRRGSVGSEWVEKRRDERRAWYARERAKVTAGGAGGGAHAVLSEEALDARVAGGEIILGRKSSVWRRRKLR